MDEQQHFLHLCLARIEQQLGWGNASSWRNEDFELLADKIFEQTRVRLSLSTLRRLWGRVKYTHAPNAATLNALAGFLGYTQWRAFCEAQAVPPAPRKTGTIKRTYRKFALIAGVILVAFSFLALLQFGRPDGVSGDFRFSYRKVSNDLPNSVVFDYSAGRPGDTGIMIRQSWDPALSEKVDGGNAQHTSIYYYPGYFDAKLMVNGEIVKHTPVYITTQGWKGIVQHNPMPLYLPRTNATGISAAEMQRVLQTADLNDQWVEFDNFRDFKAVDPDNFEVSLRVQNTATVEQALCRRVTIIVRGSNTPVIIPLSDRGATATLNLYSGDTTVSGRKHDLSAFGCDWKRPQLVTLSIRNRKVSISLKDQNVFSVTLKKSIGKIMGIKVLFEGSGTLAMAKLSSNGKTYTLE